MRRSKPRSPTARNHFERRGIGSTQTRIHHEFKSDFLQNLARLRIVESAECDARFVRCSFASLVENPLDWPDIFDRAANPKTRKNLARFLATLLMRHPAAREMVGEVNQRLRDLASGAADDARIAIRGRHGDAEISVADVREYVAISADEVRTDWLRQMPAVSRPLGDQLFARRWGLVFAETDSFITCDNPVSLDRGASRRAKFGIGTPGTLIFFPVSPQRFLVIADEWESPFMHYKLDDERVFIRRVVRSAARFVFAQRENPLIAQAIAARNEPSA